MNDLLNDLLNTENKYFLLEYKKNIYICLEINNIYEKWYLIFESSNKNEKKIMIHKDFKILKKLGSSFDINKIRLTYSEYFI